MATKVPAQCPNHEEITCNLQICKDGDGVCEDSKGGERLLQVTSQCWQSGLYSDVTVIVGEKRFPANRVVLVALSDFFRPLFKLDVKDSEVILNNVDAKDFSRLLQFAYTGELELQTDSVQSLLVAADYLDVGFVRTACEHFMIQKLDCENVCDVFNFSRTFSLEALSDAALDFMKQNLQAVSQTDSFLEINLECLVRFFESDDLVLYSNEVALRGVEREKQIFKSVLTYLSKKPDLDEASFCKLLETVRLPIMPLKDMEKCLKEFKNLKKDVKVLPYLSMRTEADTYLSRKASRGATPTPHTKFPPLWLARRKLSASSIILSPRFAAGGQLSRTPQPPKPLHSDPDIEISSIDVWIRRWNIHTVIGAIKVNYRSPKPGKKFKPFAEGTPQSGWKHHRVELFPHEYICKIVVGAGYLIDRLGFHTTSGRVLGPFGGPGGRQFVMGEEPDSRPGYLHNIVCESTISEGSSAILNLQLYWLEEM